MPSTVWCARKPYVVKQSPSEVQDLVLNHQVFWLDLLVSRRPPVPDMPPGEQVMLNRDHVSAVEWHVPAPGATVGTLSNVVYTTSYPSATVVHGASAAPRG